jgi:hypothetical protein
VYGLDTPDAFPSVWNGENTFALEQPPELDGLTCTVIEWSNGDQPLKGVLYQARIILIPPRTYLYTCCSSSSSSGSLSSSFIARSLA